MNSASALDSIPHRCENHDFVCADVPASAFEVLTTEVSILDFQRTPVPAVDSSRVRDFHWFVPDEPSELVANAWVAL